MAEIVLNVRKRLEENAAEYFERAKKERRKLEGAQKALERNRAALAVLQKDETKARKATPAESRRWYEKFRWFVSSEGFLCVGGRDATSNEIVVRKHTRPDDILFHAELEGSPFFSVQCEGKAPGEQTLQEAAIATASFSRGWRLGLSYLDVYHVKPEQVSKEARAGEYLGKGAFMIHGKKSVLPAKIALAVGSCEGRVVCGPPEAVRKSCGKAVLLRQGRMKASEAAKKIRKRLQLEAALDDIIRALPSGGVEL